MEADGYSAPTIYATVAEAEPVPLVFMSRIPKVAKGLLQGVQVMSLRDIENMGAFSVRDKGQFKFTLNAWRGEPKIKVEVTELGDDVMISIDAAKSLIEGLQKMVEHIGEVKVAPSAPAPAAKSSAPVFRNFNPDAPDDLPVAEPDSREEVKAPVLVAAEADV